VSMTSLTTVRSTTKERRCRYVTAEEIMSRWLNGSPESGLPLQFWRGRNGQGCFLADAEYKPGTDHWYLSLGDANHPAHEPNRGLRAPRAPVVKPLIRRGKA